MTHELKIEAPYFEAVLSGEKTFEIRLNDRGFQKGDKLVLFEVRNYSYYTGRTWHGIITYVTNYMQRDNNVVFGIREIAE